MFITFEGSEGSGKTIQIAQLAHNLRQLNFDVLTVREPGGTPIGDQVRKVLLSNKNGEMHARTEILLFQASRAQLVEQVIRPRLVSGSIVLCDRYADSTLAYQGYGRGADLDELRSLIRFATGGLAPDLTLLLDVDVIQGLKRRSADGDINRLDALTVDFYQRVRHGFLELAAAEPARWVVVDANQSQAQVTQEIHKTVLSRLEAWHSTNPSY
jgi:dTMP kinase